MKRFKNSGQFSKGQVPWNKGLLGWLKHTDKHKLELRDKWMGNKNPAWKGDNVGYDGIHKWIEKYGGKKSNCSICGEVKNLEWANISRGYKRDITDWICLCSACHDIYDGQVKLNKDQIKEVKILYARGTKQSTLSNHYKISQPSISRIVNNKTRYAISYLNQIV